MLTRISRGPLLLVSGLVAGALGCTAIVVSADRVAPRAAPGEPATAVQPAFGRLPLAFEKNAGQTDRRVEYLARGAGYTLFLTRRESVLSLARGKNGAPAVVRTRLAGAARDPDVTGNERLPGVVNVYKGDRKHWRSGIPTYRKVRYESVYPGIDAVYYGREGRLEYDFMVAPGADPSRIRLDFTGVLGLTTARNGDLVLRVPGGTLRHLRPVAYQGTEAARRPVDARWAIVNGRAEFRLGRYDRSRPLVIDPILTYSSYLGGSASDTPESVAIASDGVLVSGSTTSNDFPGATARSVSRTDSDAFVTKINSAGTARLYATYLAGTSTSESDVANDVVANGASAYVTGYTGNSNFPTTSDPPRLDTCSDADNDAFFVRLGSTGAMNFGTCLGGNGSDIGESIAVRTTSTGLGSSVIVHVTGYTTSTSGFPLVDAADSTHSGTDAFLARISFPSTTSCISFNICDPSNQYTTLLGGSGSEIAYGVATDSAGDAYITGYTTSNDFPGTVGTDPDSGGTDAFVARYDTDLTGTSSVKFATWFGGGGTDYGYGIDVTAAGIPWIAGKTYSFDATATAPGLPSAATTGNLRHDPSTVEPDGFIGEMSTTGTGLDSTYVGGTQPDELRDIDVVETGTKVSQYVTGITESGATAFFVLRNQVPEQPCANTNKQALVVKRSDSASDYAAYVTCIGGTTETGEAGYGITADAAGNAYVVGTTGGNFPQVSPFQPSFGGGSTDGFLMKLAQTPPTITSGPSGVIATKSASFTFSTNEEEMSYNCSTPVSNRLVAGTRGACASGSVNYSNLAEGDHLFEAVTVDDTDAESAPAVQAFTVDTVAPAGFDLVAPDNAANTTTLPTFSWQQAADAGTAVTYSIMVDGQKLQDVGSGACSGGTCTAQAATPIATGAHRWNVVATDGASPPHSTSSTSTRTFTAIDPPVARLTVAPNPALVGRPVTFDATASTDASHTIAKHIWDLDGDGTFELETAEPTTTRSYDAPGVVNVGLKVVDSTGTESPPATVPLSVNSISSGTQIGVSINEGAQYTNKVDVDLTVNFPPSTTSLLVANDGGFVKALNFRPEKLVKWRLDSSGPERLPKTVYLRFLTGTFASPNYTDDIILDERPPVVDQAALVNPPSAASAVAAALRTYKVRVKARDSNSGVRGVQITANKRKPGKLIRYTAKTRGKLKTVRVKSAKRPRFLRAKDLAGNYSRWKKLK